MPDLEATISPAAKRCQERPGAGRAWRRAGACRPTRGPGLVGRAL